MERTKDMTGDMTGNMAGESASRSTPILPVAGTPDARLAELRRRHPRFIYRSFTAEPHPESRGIRLRFDFRLEPDITFAPETVFEGVGAERLTQLPAEILENFYFHLGMIESLSYWKAACSPEIRVEQREDAPAGALSEEQTAWWMNLLHQGMGEYFYVNRIDFRAPDLVHFVASPREDPRRPSTDLRGGEKALSRRSEKPYPATADGVILSEASSGAKDLLLLGPSEKQQVLRRSAPQDDPSGVSGSRVPNRESRDLVLTSGGKDSVVTLETLRAAGRAFDCLLLNPTPAALTVARQAGCEHPIIVRRTIDRRLLELNAAGYLNGHTPFSALLAFLGVAAAALYGYRRVIVSNERSAEEATAEYLGTPINHQYSKTFEFEAAFREYSRKYLSPEIEYFSLPRPLYELQIARRFAKYPQYFSLFRSCNRGMATNTWCGRCAKCLFVWTVLYPFVEREQMLGIFGNDLFEWAGGAVVLRELLGLDRAKPFECVGTKDETLAALHLCAERYRSQGLALPPALAPIAETVLAPCPGLPALAARILSSWSDQHHLPRELAAKLHQSAITP